MTEQEEHQVRIEGLYRHAAQLVKADSIETVAKTSFSIIEQILGVDRGGFGLVDNNVLRFIHVAGAETERPIELPLDGKGVTVRTVRTRQTQLVPDTRKNNDYVPIATYEDRLSELAVPVKINDQVVAVINIESNRLNAFTEQDQKLLETFSEHVASAMIRLRQIRELEKHDEKLVALHSGALQLHEVDSVDEIAVRSLEIMAKIMGFKHAGFAVVADNVVRYIAVKGVQVPLPMDLPLDGNSVTARVARIGKTRLIADVREEEGFIRSTTEEEFYPLSELTVPVKVDDDVVAVLNAESDMLNAFDEHDEKLMELLASHVSASLSSMQRREIRLTYQRRLKALHDHAASLGSAETIEDVAEQTFDTVETVLGFDQGGFGVVEANLLRFVEIRGATTVKTFELPLDGPGITIRTVKTGETQLINDVRTDVDFVQGPALVPPLSELAVPVKVEGRVVAIINVESDRLNAFTKEDQELLETLSQHVASAMDRLNYVKQLEQLVEERTRELKQAERMAAIGETAAMVSHDLSSPLQAMTNLLYLVKKKSEEMPPPVAGVLSKKGLKQLFKKLGNQVEYMNNIILELQDLSRPMRPQLVEVDLRRLLDEVLSTTVPPRKIEVSIQGPENPTKATVDPTMMKRLIGNLITNALQAMPKDGRLSVELSQTEEATFVSVRDTGVGMSEENLRRIFEPLFTTKSKGTGLGLAICKRIAEAHGGSIGVESQLGKGSTFTVKIPHKKAENRTYSNSKRGVAKPSPTALGGPSTLSL